MRIWSDPRDGRTWEIRTRTPWAAPRPKTSRLEPNEHPCGERIHFSHPPGRAPRLGGAVPSPAGRRIHQLDDLELQALLDRALNKVVAHA